MIYFKLNMAKTEETKLVLSYFNTVKDLNIKKEIVVNRQSAGDLVHMVARFGITNLQIEKSFAHGPKYFCAFVKDYDIEKYLKRAASDYQVLCGDTEIFV